MGEPRSPGRGEFALLLVVCTAVIWLAFFALSARNHELARQGGVFFAPATALDAQLPLVPELIWAYLLFYPALFAMAVVTLADRRVMWEGAVTYIAIGGMAFLAFLLLPSRMFQPDVSGCASLSCQVLGWMYRVDEGFQIFPSLHVAYPFGIWLMFRRYAPRLVVPFGIVVAAIMASTVLLKRHYLIDIPAGVLVGAAAFALGRALGPRLALAAAEAEGRLFAGRRPSTSPARPPSTFPQAS